MNERDLALQLLRNCNYIRSSKRNISLDNSVSQHTLNDYHLRKNTLIRDISKYRNLREEKSLTNNFNSNGSYSHQTQSPKA